MPIISNFPALGGGTPGPDYSSWFGTGEDGDLTVSTDVALPVALDSGQIIKQYNNLTITSTGVLHPANRCNGMILLVKGDLTVDGTIHVDKCAPLANDNEAPAAQEQHIVLCGVTAGGKGGDGGDAYESTPSSTASPGGSGGPGFQFGGGFGGGGGGVGAYLAGRGGSSNPRPPAGTTIPYPASTSGDSQYGAGGSGQGGSSVALARGGAGPGGGGGQGAGTRSGDAGDAIGGGALWIFAQGKVRIGGTAKISARGGDGGDAYGYAASGTILEFGGGGGSGGGGIVCIVHTGDIVKAGAVTASPGTAGINKTNSAYAAGQSGESGTVLITNISDLLGEGEWEPEWVTCSFDYANPGKPSNLVLVVNTDGVPTATSYTSETAPARYTTLQVLKGSVFAFAGPATMVTGDGATHLFGSGLEPNVYVATGDFTITG